MRFMLKVTRASGYLERMSICFAPGSREGVTIMSREGSTSRDATAAMNIITAVSIPYDANIGIGAKAIMPNPTMLLAAEATRATPVPLVPLVRASRLPADFDSSSLYLWVM